MFNIAAIPYHAPIQEGGLYNTIVIGFPLTLHKKRANMLLRDLCVWKVSYIIHQCAICSSFDYL